MSSAEVLASIVNLSVHSIYNLSKSIILNVLHLSFINQREVDEKLTSLLMRKRSCLFLQRIRLPRGRLNLLVISGLLLKKKLSIQFLMITYGIYFRGMVGKRRCHGLIIRKEAWRIKLNLKKTLRKSGVRHFNFSRFPKGFAHCSAQCFLRMKQGLEESVGRWLVEKKKKWFRQSPNK